MESAKLSISDGSWTVPASAAMVRAACARAGRGEDSRCRDLTALAETRIDRLKRAASHPRFPAGAGDGRPAAFCSVLGPGFLANSASDRCSDRQCQAAGRTCVDAICSDPLAFSRLAASPGHEICTVGVQGIKKGNPNHRIRCNASEAVSIACHLTACSDLDVRSSPNKLI